MLAGLRLGSYAARLLVCSCSLIEAHPCALHASPLDGTVEGAGHIKICTVLAAAQRVVRLAAFDAASVAEIASLQSAALSEIYSRWAYKLWKLAGASSVAKTFTSTSCVCVLYCSGSLCLESDWLYAVRYVSARAGFLRSLGQVVLLVDT